jgi:hypothetical protein
MSNSIELACCVAKNSPPPRAAKPAAAETQEQCGRIDNLNAVDVLKIAAAAPCWLLDVAECTR